MSDKHNHPLPEQEESNLKVQGAIPQPPSVNKNAAMRIRRKRRTLFTIDEYVDGILNGNRSILSQAITLVESLLPAHHKTAQDIIERCLPNAGNCIRLGITGVPGVGKSTFIEAFGKYLTDKGHKVAVLAIDPSSQRTKGSILGDKTRMEELANDPNAFIRPSPSAGSLGGVAQKTRETSILCEAAGFDVIIIETVGVGQSETAVHSMVDFFLLLMLAGAGDELQGIKRGIMEMADSIVINKADGDNYNKATLAKASYQSALHLFPPAESGWTPKVDTCSALEKNNVDKVWEMILEYTAKTKDNGYFEHKRKQQSKSIMLDTIDQQLKSAFYQDSQVQKEMSFIEENLLDENLSSYQAAAKLLDIYFQRCKLRKD